MNVPTQNGYQLEEVISALQKDIRRGNEENAMYWALELVPNYEAYLWRRLTIILHEDIGIAMPSLLSIIPAINASYVALREAGKGDECRLLIANAILLMCRAPKTRMADHFQTVIDTEKKRGVRRPIPDYALDRHTESGRSKGRSWDHWLNDGCQLENEKGVDPYAERAAAIWKSPEFTKLPKTEWKKRGKNGQLDLFE